MERAQARVEIDKLGNSEEEKIGNLLLDMELELVGCGEASKIRKNNRDIGQIDFIFRDSRVKAIFFVEVSKQVEDRAEKANYFFTRWEIKKNVKLVQDKFELPTTFKIVRLYCDLSSKDDCPLPKDIISDRKRNHWLTSYDVAYFMDAVHKVGKWASNDFFSFLNLKPRDPTSRSIPGVQFFLGEDIRAYAYVDTASNLLRYCYIFRRKKNDKGYQRMLNKGRIGNIARKIESGNIFAFPNSILISCPDATSLCRSPVEKTECPCAVTMQMPNYFSACRVIDGQHRLLGFAKLDEVHQEQHFIPVVAIEDIDQHREMRTFIEINSGQKKIDRNLILVLQADFEWDVNDNPKAFFEKQAVLVVKRLNETQGSPLRNMVFIPEALAKKKGKITLNTIVSAILNNNFIGRKHHLYQEDWDDIDTPYKLLRGCFILAKMKLPKYCRDAESFLLTNKGLRIFFRLLQVFERNKLKDNISIELGQFFSDLAQVFSDEFIKRLEDYYGEGGKVRAVEEICRLLKKKKKERYKPMTTDLRRV